MLTGEGNGGGAVEGGLGLDEAVCGTTVDGRTGRVGCEGVGCEPFLAASFCLRASASGSTIASMTLTSLG